jgi:hypothetical protein
MTLDCPYCDETFDEDSWGRNNRVQHLYAAHGDEFGTAGTWVRKLQEVDS